MSDSTAFCYCSLNIVKGIDVFTKKDRKNAITEILNDFILDKGLHVFVWLIMPNRVHLIVKADSDLSETLFELKYEASEKLKEILEHENSVASNLLLKQLIEQSNEANLIWNVDLVLSYLESPGEIDEKIEMIHRIPVSEKIVEKPEHYLFSSAGDFLGWRGYVDVDTEI